MTEFAKLKIDVDVLGRGTVTLDGIDISNCVHSIMFKAEPGQLSLVTLAIHADFEADLLAAVDRIPVARSQEPVPQTVTTADGRTLTVRHRAAS